MKLTEEHLQQARSINGGWSRKQVEVLGIGWPLEYGWKQDVLGQDFHPEDIADFISLKDAHIKPKALKQKMATKTLQKAKTKFSRRPKPDLPILPLNEAIKRLGDDAVYAKVDKAMSWKDELD